MMKHDSTQLLMCGVGFLGPRRKRATTELQQPEGVDMIRIQQVTDLDPRETFFIIIITY